MRMFQSKHQKLILQCYPPGKDADKKANPLELLYLLYYALTRRVKLEKVMVFLERKTRLDASHSRAGNMHVTLEIVQQLIVKCADDVNVIAADALLIMSTILNVKDLLLAKLVMLCFSTLCKYVGPTIFLGDQMFIQQFTVVLERLINYTGDSTHANESRLLRILAIEATLGVYNYNTELGKHLMASLVPQLMDTLHDRWPTVAGLAKQVKANTSSREDDLAKVTLRQIAEHEDKIHAALDADDVTIDDVYDEALFAVKVLFDTTHTWQVQELTNQVVAGSQSGPWIAGFVELVTTYVPVQIRFLVLGTLLRQLTRLLRLLTPKADAQLLYANCILQLVQLEVLMIGLLVSDVIQEVLSLHTNLVLKQARELSPDVVKELLIVYLDIVCHVSTRIYYLDQVADLILEILIKVDTLFDQGHNTKQPDQVYGLIISFLDDIREIFALLATKNQALITRNRVLVECWEALLGIILANPHDYKFSTKQFSHIQDKFLQCFDDCLIKELALDQRVQDDGNRKLITGSSSTQPGNLLAPQYSEYIATRDNFVTCLLIHVDKFLAYDQPLAAAQLMNDVLVDVVYTLGINFMANYVPYFYQWVLGNSQAHDVLLKLTFGFTVMYYCLRVLETKYPQCHGYVQLSKFYGDVNDDINSRKNNLMWVFDIDQDLGGKATLKFNGVTFQSTKPALQEFVEGNDFIDEYIDVDAPLILDVLKMWEPKQPLGVLTPRLAADTTDAESHFSYNLARNSLRLGLGSANDILLIHLELMHQTTAPAFLRGPLPPLPQLNVGNGNGNGNSGGYTGHSAIAQSLLNTGDMRVFNLPKVTELREAVMRLRPVLAQTPLKAAKGLGQRADSVLGRLAVIPDVNSILGGLEDEDDRMIVV